MINFFSRLVFESLDIYFVSYTVVMIFMFKSFHLSKLKEICGDFWCRPAVLRSFNMWMWVSAAISCGFTLHDLVGGRWKSKFNDRHPALGLGFRCDC